MSIGVLRNGDGSARANRGGPFERLRTEAEQNRARRRRKAWAAVLAWLWPSQLGEDVFPGGRTPMRGGTSAVQKALWSRRRRRVILAAILLATAAAAPGFMGGAGGLLDGRLNLLQGGAAARGGQSGSRTGAVGSSAGGPSAGGSAKLAAHAHGQAGNLNSSGVKNNVSVKTHEPQVGDGQANGQGLGGAGQGDESGASPADGEGGQPGLTFLDSGLTGSGGGGGIGFGGAGGAASGGGGGGGIGGGGGGGPGGQPPADAPGDNPGGGNPQDLPGGGGPTGAGPPTLSDPPIDDVGSKPITPNDSELPQVIGDHGNTQDPGGPTSAAPEPQAWLLMIAGFGAVGWVLRRRRVSVLA